MQKNCIKPFPADQALMCCHDRYADDKKTKKNISQARSHPNSLSGIKVACLCLINLNDFVLKLRKWGMAIWAKQRKFALNS